MIKVYICEDCGKIAFNLNAIPTNRFPIACENCFMPLTKLQKESIIEYDDKP